jgi:glycosyltransferase involved in cell wall biosynthesis
LSLKLAACIIAKNEEENLPRLLKSIKGKFDEIVLVDTGSTDRTKEIAKSYGCRVVEHEWNGFADARNRAVKEVSIDADWLWHFDADFELEEEEYKKAITYLKNLKNSPIDGILIGVKNFSSTGEIKALSSHIFIHKPGIEWKGKIHETPKVKRVVGIPIFVNHYGYADAKTLLQKAKRNYELLLEELDKLDKNSKDYLIKLFYIAQTTAILSYEDASFLEKVKETALEFLSKIEGREKEFGFFATYIYNYLLNVLSRLGEEDLLEEYLRKIIDNSIPVPDLYLRAYFFFMEKENKKDAFVSLKKLVELYDEIEKNPFSFGIAFGSDKVETFKKFLLTGNLPNFPKEFIDKLREEWKKEGGKYKGILVSLLLSPRERIKLLRKLAIRYPSEDFITKLLLKTMEETRDFSELRKLLPAYKNWPAYWIVKGKLLEEEGKTAEAIASYVKYLEMRKDPFLASYVLSLAKKEGIVADIKK